MTLQPPLEGQELYKVNFQGDYKDPDTRVPVENIEEANVITSKVKGKAYTHKVALDIDLPCKLIESSTPGHFHLYIDYEIPETLYWQLLNVLADVGILELGYVNASMDREFTSLRLPWIKKEQSNA